MNPQATRRLLKEIHHLRNEPPEGIRITTNEDNILDITGIIAGPAGTPYENGYYRISFTFTEEFPNIPPKCRMLTKIFHPNISPTGEICVNTLKKDWKPTYGIQHILITVKCLLIYPNPESALDEEAGRMLLEQYEGYATRAKMMCRVHATPKRPPSEFDIPSAVAESSKSQPTGIVSSPTTTTTATTGEPENAPHHASTTTTTPQTPLLQITHTNKPRSISSNSKSNLPPSSSLHTPLVTVISTTSTSVPPTGTTHVPSMHTTPTNPNSTGVEPLATRNHNQLDKVITSSSSTVKPIKRSATTVAVGADKRKKALKRL